MRRLLHTLLAITLALTLVSPAVPAAASPAFSDMAGHWAVQWVDPWAGLGLIKGYPDGTFGPGRPITKAEMCALINRALGLGPSSVAMPETTPSFGGAWYEETIAVALAAGYIKPYADGLIRPDAPLSRQQMAEMIALALKLEPAGSTGELDRFADKAAITDEFRAALEALVALGHLRGFEDETLRPGQITTRAEAVSLLARALGVLYTAPGAYGPLAGEAEFIPGSVVVSAPGVTLRNLVIPGDLYITAAALDGVTRLHGVAVIGTLYVSGGAGVVLDGSRATCLVVDSHVPITVQASGEAYLGRAVIRSDAALSEKDLITDGFTNVIVKALPTVALTLDGVFQTVKVTSPDADITLAAGDIGELTVLAGGAGAEIELSSGCTLSALFAHGRASVSGTGKIYAAAAFSAGVDLAIEPDRLTVAPGVVTTVGGKTYSGELVSRREYTFGDGANGWTGGFCDYPVDTDPAEWGLEFRHSDVPAEIGPGKGLLVAGNNHSDDLFMYVARRLGAAEGLLPNTTYTVVVEFDFGTDAPAGAVGIGGAPGEAVHVKVGAAAEEPRPVEDDSKYWRLSVDKGSQNDEGRNAVQVGDVAKSTGEFDGYELKTLSNAGRPLTVTTGDDGTLWVFVGTDSGFEGYTALYYTRIQVTVSVTQAE